MLRIIHHPKIRGLEPILLIMAPGTFGNLAAYHMNIFPFAIDRECSYHHLLHTVSWGLFHCSWLNTGCDIDPAYPMQQHQTPMDPH